MTWKKENPNFVYIPSINIDLRVKIFGLRVKFHNLLYLFTKTKLRQQHFHTRPPQILEFKLLFLHNILTPSPLDYFEYIK